MIRKKRARVDMAIDRLVQLASDLSVPHETLRRNVAAPEWTWHEQHRVALQIHASAMVMRRFVNAERLRKAKP